MKKTRAFIIAVVIALNLALTGCNNGSGSSVLTSHTSDVSSGSVSSTVSEMSSTASETSSAASETSSTVSETSSTVSETSSATSETSGTASETSSAVSETASALWETAQYKEDTELGKGKNSVKIEVKADGKSVTLTVHSDNDNLEKILTENKLVEGDQSEFGLYIKKVNGIRADYDADKAYWALCKNGEMTATGASGITVADGEHYEFVYTPA